MLGRSVFKGSFKKSKFMRFPAAEAKDDKEWRQRMAAFEEKFEDMQEHMQEFEEKQRELTQMKERLAQEEKEVDEALELWRRWEYASEGGYASPSPE